MTRLLRAAAAALLVLAGLFCSLRAVDAAEGARGLGGLFLARYEAAQTASPNLRQALERDGAHCALLRERTRTVEAPLLARSERMVHIEVAGDPALLFLPGRLQAGGFPNDQRGCVVDEASAYRLWGSAAPLGFVVECDGREYAVTGVVKAARPLLLTAAGDGESAFTAALFRASADAAFPQQAMQEFEEMLAAGVPLREEPARAGAGARFAARLPILVLLLLLAARCLRRGGVPALPRAALLLLAAAVAVVLLRLEMPLAPDMLPTRWSDFSFWNRRWEMAADRFCTAWTTPGTTSSLLLFLEVLLPAWSWAGLALLAFLPANALLPVAKAPDSGYNESNDPEHG